ncbi:MAG: prepilin-type N-terminal cleavage/methylation domain-containing protein [Candidatus Omnitrophota bacterium]
MKAFTLVEVLVSAAILSLIIAGLYAVLNIGNATFGTDTKLLDLQQNARLAMEWMVRETRESSPAGTQIAGGNSITFDTPNEADIQYYRDAANFRLVREYPTGTVRIIANNIETLSFSLSGFVLTIQFTARNPQRADLSLSLKQQVRLRNE